MKNIKKMSVSVPNKYDFEVAYNDDGQTLQINIQTFYENLEVFSFPENCCKCPCGFKDCGRNVPFEKEDYFRRPSTCKLKKVNIKDIINEIEKDLT